MKTGMNVETLLEATPELTKYSNRVHTELTLLLVAPVSWLTGGNLQQSLLFIRDYNNSRWCFLHSTFIVS